MKELKKKNSFVFKKGIFKVFKTTVTSFTKFINYSGRVSGKLLNNQWCLAMIVQRDCSSAGASMYVCMCLCGCVCTPESATI